MRIGQGAASGMINTTVYAFASAAYPDEVDKIIAFVEGAAGLGVIVGPVIGSFMHEAVGF